MGPIIKDLGPGSLDVQVRECPVADCDWTYGLVAVTDRHVTDAQEAFAAHEAEKHSDEN